MHNGERMTKWYQDNLSKVNYDKYQAMVLGNPKGERNVDLDICDEKVEQSQSIKILGVNLDENRNFRDHIRSVCKNVGGMIGILRRCWGSPNDVTFSLFCVSHYHKVQVFIQPLQILISANECKILSVCQYRQIHCKL